MTSLADRLAAVDARIAAAAEAASRDPAGITRIVVTKFHPVDLVRDLYALGVRDLGENRQQELTAKRDEVADLDGIRWHFIGQAQTNKARAIREASTAVHSVDRERLAEALHAAGAVDRDRIADALDAAGSASDAGPLDVLLQVNLTDDPGRGGVAPAGISALAEHVAALPSLRLRGVMAVAPLDRPAAEAFAELARHAVTVRRVVPDAVWISAGMTADFEEAIAVGATHLRIGSAITGPRPNRA